MVHLAVLTKDKVMKNLGYCDNEHLQERIGQLKILRNCNYYITANSTKRFTSRSGNNLFSLNNIVLDFDIHKRMNRWERTHLIEEFVWRSKRDLFYIQAPYNIPVPNVIHYTGRGVQFWWHIDEASAQLLFLYQAVIDRLASVMGEFLEEYPTLKKYIEIDTVASKNAIGLFRLFDTYNTHTNQKTTVEVLHTGSIDLNNFHRILSALQSPTVPREAKVCKQRKQKTVRKTRTYNSSYVGLHKKRLYMIERLAEAHEDNIGERDMMIFLAYNTAVQCMPIDEAQELCRKINSLFSEPLKSLDYIFKEIRADHYYKFSNKTFYEKLHIDTDTQEALSREYAKVSMNLTRNMLRKQRQAEREQKKERAVELLKTGCTHKQVAEQTGLSPSTVGRLSSSVTKHEQVRPWEEFGISKATYYRRKKNGTL